MAAIQSFIDYAAIYVNLVFLAVTYTFYPSSTWAIRTPILKV